MTSKQVLRASGFITLRALAREIRSAGAITADSRSFLRLSRDLVLYRALKIHGFGLRNRERTISIRNGITITYRLNRGDIQSLREVWFDKVYQLPYRAEIKQVVDLGANIGLSSLYFSKTHPVTRLVAVEPNPANASLVRRNLQNNGIQAVVIEAAVGPEDGVAYFSDGVDSNLGAVSSQGREVRMVCMHTVCSEGGITSIDLMKMDIEGGEQALLTGSLSWLPMVQNLMAEFHPHCVDYPALISILCQNGFKFLKCGSVLAHTADTFQRQHATQSVLAGHHEAPAEVLMQRRAN